MRRERIVQPPSVVDLKGTGIGPDGSTIDTEGYLWNAQWDGWRVARYAPDGRLDRLVELPVQKPTSCMFGGADMRTLYVTSAIWDLTAPSSRGSSRMQAACLLSTSGSAACPSRASRDERDQAARRQRGADRR